MDDYLAISSAVYRFAVAFLQAAAGGERVRDALEKSVPPSPGAAMRISFRNEQVEPLAGTGTQVREVADRFGRSLPDHLASCGLRPELLREVDLATVRGKRGRLRYKVVALDDLGRGYVVQVVLPDEPPIDSAGGADTGGANAGSSTVEAEAGATPDPAHI